LTHPLELDNEEEDSIVLLQAVIANHHVQGVFPLVPQLHILSHLHISVQQSSTYIKGSKVETSRLGYSLKLKPLGKILLAREYVTLTILFIIGLDGGL
jgi:hypothetical protein